MVGSVKTERRLYRHLGFLYTTYTSPMTVFMRRPIIPPALPVSPLNVVRSALLLQIHVGGLTPNPSLKPQPQPKIIHFILCDPALPSPQKNLFKLFLVFFFFFFLWVYMMKLPVLYTSNRGKGAGEEEAGRWGGLK